MPRVRDSPVLAWPSEASPGLRALIVTLWCGNASLGRRTGFSLSFICFVN